MYTSVWGPSTWRLIHSVAFTYPKHPTFIERQRYKMFFESLAYRGGVENAIAIVSYPDNRPTLNDLKSDGLYLVAEAVEKPGNLGAILRTADASKMDAIIVCDELLDVFHPNVIRNSDMNVKAYPYEIWHYLK